MKLVFRIIIITALTYFLSGYLPWWIVVFISGIVCFIVHGNGINAFISGFLGGGITWLAYAWVLDIETQSVLSNKVVGLFPFDDNTFLIIAAGLIGALSGGLGGLTGNTFRSVLTKKKDKSFYT